MRLLSGILAATIIALAAATTSPATPAATSTPTIATRAFVAPFIWDLRFDAAHDALWVLGNDAVGTTTLFKLDPGTLAVEAKTPIDHQGQATYQLTVGLDRVFVTNFPNDYGDHSLLGTVSEYNANGAHIRTISTYGHGPTGTTVYDGALWVSNHHQDAAGTSGSVVELDPDSGALLARVPLGADIFCCGPNQIAAADGALWVGLVNLNAIVRIDPSTLQTTLIPDRNGAPQGSFPAGACGPIATDETHHRLWIGDGGCLPNGIQRIDTSTATITQSFTPGGAAWGLAYGYGALWASLGDNGRNGTSGFLVRIDPDTGLVTARLATDGGAGGVALGDNAVYIAAPISGEILKVAP